MLILVNVVIEKYLLYGTQTAELQGAEWMILCMQNCMCSLNIKVKFNLDRKSVV